MKFFTPAICRAVFRPLPALGALWLAGLPCFVRAATPPPENQALWPGPAPVGDGTTDSAVPTITIHRPDPEKSNGAAMVICPGGGYGGLVIDAEGHNIAKWLNQHGITGIVLEYRFPKGRASVPILDAQRVIRTARAKSADWSLKTDRIGIIGFSAGGHLAATAGTLFDTGNPQAADPIERQSCRPDFVLLVYPVITMGEKGEKGTKANLLGSAPKQDLMEKFSPERQVTDQTPPMFLTHSIRDAAVSVDNSRMMTEALKARQIPVEYMELTTGGHTLNALWGPLWDSIRTRMLAWLAERKVIPAADAAIPDAPSK